MGAIQNLTERITRPLTPSWKDNLDALAVTFMK